MTIIDDLSGREWASDNPYEWGDVIWYYILYVDGTEIAMCRGEEGFRKLEEVGKDEAEEEYTITTKGYKP